MLAGTLFSSDGQEDSGDDLSIDKDDEKLASIPIFKPLTFLTLAVPFPRRDLLPPPLHPS